MSDPSAEDLAAEFLDLLDGDPGLDPGAFAARHPARRDEVLSAIQAAIDASALLPPEEGASAHPRTIGPYTIVRVIGRGGMGVVYEVERDGARFAMKRIPLAPLLGPRVLERFRRESGILARLSHPDIVKVHDSGIQDETPWFVMDLVDGPGLAEARDRLSMDEKLRLVMRLCRAVHAAHEAGVVHRDLKPQNVLVRRDGSPVLLDFGLGSDDELPALTSTGDLLGTPRYMAPEQVRDSRVDRRTDVYGLGLILYELVVGSPAYPAPSREGVLDAIRHGRFRRPGRTAKDLPRDLESVILTALAFDPRHRFQTAEAMADDLDRLAAGKPVLARPPGPAVRAAQWVRLNRARTAAGFFALAAAITGVWMALLPKGLDAAHLRESNTRFDAGVALWLDGKDAQARDELRHAIDLNPGHASARVLAADLAQEPPPRPAPDAPLAEALESLRAGRYDAVRPSVEAHLRAHERDALTSALLGLGALGQRDFERAEKELAAAAIDIPPSRRLHESLGKARRRLGKLEDAERDFRQAIAIGPETAELWTQLAEVYREEQNLDKGIEAAEAAVRLAGKDSGKASRLLASLYNFKGDRAKAQAIVRGLLERTPRDAEAQYLLAFSLDSDHDIVGSEAAYRRVLELRPNDAPTMVCLANLYSGADRGHCKGCDRAYAEHPEFLRVEEAERRLLAALRLDAGKAKSLTQNALAIVSKLPDRTRVVALLRELTAGKEKTPAVLNLEWLLRRLELNEAGEKR